MATQATKLGLKPGMRVGLVGAPAGWTLDDPPPFTSVPAGESADVVILFAAEAAGLSEAMLTHGRRIFPAGALWVAWPRRAAGHLSDLGDVVVRDAGLAHGLVDVKVAALDENWSSLKFVWRLSER